MKTTFFRLIARAACCIALTGSVYAVDVPLLADAHTISTASNTNYGSSATLTVNPTSRAWMQFDLNAALPASAFAKQLPNYGGFQGVLKAVLKVPVSGATGTGNITITAAKPAAPLVEATVTHTLLGSGANDPVTLNPYASQANVIMSSGRKFLSFDVTELVKDWLDGTLVNNGLIISSTSTASLTIPSKDAGAVSASLDILYVPARINPQGDVNMGIFTNGLSQ